MARLTDKQFEFINQYFLCGMNGTEAVIQAGYKVKNRQTAAAISSENLRKSHVREAIDKRLQESTLSANQVLHILSVHALGDMRYVLDEDGVPDMNVARRNGVTNTVKKMRHRTVITEHTTIHEIEVELHDPQAAAVQLGRYYKLFTDRVEVMDWQTEAVLAIRSGEVDYEALVAEFGHDLATQLFQQAGVPVAR
jgi:Phage terminase, small subunit